MSSPCEGSASPARDRAAGGRTRRQIGSLHPPLSGAAPRPAALGGRPRTGAHARCPDRRGGLGEADPHVGRSAEPGRHLEGRAPLRRGRGRRAGRNRGGCGERNPVGAPRGSSSPHGRSRRPAARRARAESGVVGSQGDRRVSCWGRRRNLSTSVNIQRTTRCARHPGWRPWRGQHPRGGHSERTCKQVRPGRPSTGADLRTGRAWSGCVRSCSDGVLHRHAELADGLPVVGEEDAHVVAVDEPAAGVEEVGPARRACPAS